MLISVPAPARMRALVTSLAAAVLLPGCSDVIVGYFSGTEDTSAAGSSDVDPSASSTVALDTTSPGSGSDTASEGFMPPGCFTDDFADGILDEPRWNTWAEADSYLEEIDGRLSLVPPTYGLYDTGVVGRFDHHFPFENGRVRLRVVAAPPVDRPAGLFLMVGDPPEGLSIRLADGNLQLAGSIDEMLVFEELKPFSPYPSWIGIRGEGPLAHFEISDDGQTWTTLSTRDKPGTFDEAAALIMVQTFDAYPDRMAAAVDDLEVCIQ